MKSTYKVKDSNSLLCGSDLASEAKALLPFLETGSTVEQLRLLIAISPSEERQLFQIESILTARRSISHRKEVAAEFERLIAQRLRSDDRKCPRN